jgi:hypothetical protein
MKTPTQSDLADFRGFCRNASTRQLPHIEEKERSAGRHHYADIAAEVLQERNR